MESKEILEFLSFLKLNIDKPIVLKRKINSLENSLKPKEDEEVIEEPAKGEEPKEKTKKKQQ